MTNTDKPNRLVMRFILFLGLLCLLTGCSEPDPYWEKMKPLTNQQIKEQIFKCNQGMLKYTEYDNSHYQIVYIQCY